MINSPDSRARDARDELTAERQRVAEQLDNLGHESARDQFDEGFADSGQVTAERGEAEALIGSLVETLDDVDHALTKLDSGSYGLCEACGTAIDDARLEAMPAARYCIGCAAKRR
jgi:DnaK suppressor protein